MAQGQLFLTADSDDAFKPTALERLAHHWENISVDERKYFVGVCGLCEDQYGKKVGDNFPGTWGIDSNSRDMHYKYRVRGEKWGFSRTDILRQHPFPENIPGHVPEGVVWMTIARDYQTRFVNETFRIYYQGANDQLTNSGNIGSNANGALYQKCITLSNEIQYFYTNPKHFLLEAARWTRFALHTGSNRVKGINYYPKNFSGRLIIAITAPIGVIWWMIDNIKRK